MSDHSFAWGTTFPVDITVRLGAAAVNLTGKKLILMAKYRTSDVDDDAVLSLSSDPGEGIEITNAAGGLARATITPAMVADLPPGKETRLVYDVRLIDGASPYVVASGRFRILPVVAQALS